MKKILWGLVLVSAALAACTAQPVEPLPGSEAIEASSTTRPTVEQTRPATATLTPAPSITPSPTPSVAQECFEQHSQLPAEIIPPGQLVVEDDLGLAIIDFSQQTQRKVASNSLTAGVSPDGKWLAYDNTDYLLIESADGSQSFQIPMKLEWLGGSGPLLWLNNEQLLFSNLEDDGITSVVVLNPFSGEEERLIENYPEITGLYWGAQIILFQFGHGLTAYDPSLRYVVYPEYVPNEYYNYRTLWDRTTQRAIAKVPATGYWGTPNFPVWDETQQRFLIVAYPDSDSRVFEWISVGLDGSVERLTHLEEYASEYEIENYAKLSPDGKTLAFIFISPLDSSNQSSSYHLFLLNLETGDVTDTCLSAYSVTFSTDSQFLAITDSPETGGTDTIRLLHLETRQSYKIIEQNHAYAYGWLNEP